MSEPRSALAVGVVIAPAVAIPAALALSPVPLVAPESGPFGSQATALVLAALFLSPLVRSSASRRTMLAEAVAVAAFSAAALAAAALASGSPAVAAESAAGTGMAASAFVLGRAASHRGDRAVSRHLVFAFAAVFAAPFVAYLLLDFGAPGAVSGAGTLRELNPLRALPPWEGRRPSWLALALPLTLLAALFAPRRRADRTALLGAAAFLLATALAAPIGSASIAPSADVMIAVPAREGEWVAVRATGAAFLSIGGGARVEPRSDGGVVLVPVGPAGAATITPFPSADAPPAATLAGPGAASAADVRVGVLSPPGSGDPLPLPSAEPPVRVARVPREPLAAFGADYLSALDALVVPAGAPPLSASERDALAGFARRGRVLIVPAGDDLGRSDAGRGRVIASSPPDTGSLVRVAAIAVADLPPPLEAGAVDPEISPLAAAWRKAAAAPLARAFAAHAIVFSLLVVLFLATRFARGASLALGAVLLSGAAVGAAVLVRGDPRAAIGAETRVVVARARGGPGRLETWLALAPFGRASARFEGPARAGAPRFREVAPAPVATGGVLLAADGSLGVDLARDALRVFVGVGDGLLEGSVGVEGLSLTNATASELLDVRLVEGGVARGEIRRIGPGETLAWEDSAPPRGAGLDAAVGRWLVARAARAGGAGSTHVIARRAPAPGGSPASPSIARAESEWLVLLVD